LEKNVLHGKLNCKETRKQGTSGIVVPVNIHNERVNFGAPHFFTA